MTPAHKAQWCLVNMRLLSFLSINTTKHTFKLGSHEVFQTLFLALATLRKVTSTLTYVCVPLPFIPVVWLSFQFTLHKDSIKKRTTKLGAPSGAQGRRGVAKLV